MGFDHFCLVQGHILFCFYYIQLEKLVKIRKKKMELKKISSVSARKLKCLAQLDSETFKLGSTQQGNFQLELITNSKYDNGPDRKWTKRIIVQCVSILKVLLQGLHQNKFVLISNGIQ